MWVIFLADDSPKVIFSLKKKWYKKFRMSSATDLLIIPQTNVWHFRVHVVIAVHQKYLHMYMIYTIHIGPKINYFQCFRWDILMRKKQQKTVEFIAPDKAPFPRKRIDIFLISPWNHMFWILIRSASVRHFYWVSQHTVLWRNKKKIVWIPTLLSGAMWHFSYLSAKTYVDIILWGWFSKEPTTALDKRGYPHNVFLISMKTYIVGTHLWSNKKIMHNFVIRMKEVPYLELWPTTLVFMQT